MINNKVKNLIATLMLGILLASPITVHAKTNDIVEKEHEKTLSSNLVQTKNYDLLKINSKIDKLISSKYEAMKTWEFKSVNNIVKDPNLLDLMDKTNKFTVMWHEKGNKKIEYYNSNVKIDSITSIKDDTYVVNATYGVEFKLCDTDTISKSTEEKYRFEIKLDNNEYYISKMLDLIEDVEEQETETLNYNTTDFNNYDSIVNDKLNTVNDKLNNIDKYYNEIKSLKVDSSPSVFAISRFSVGDYNGYNHSGAIDYALKYAESPNPQYKNHGDNDCTNFVSQCAAVGGGVPGSTMWFPDSRTWINVIDFYNYMIREGYASNPPDGCKHSQLGDIIEFYKPSKQTWTHAVILTGMGYEPKTGGQSLLFCGHSRPRLNYPVFTAFIENGYSDIRLLKFW